MKRSGSADLALFGGSVPHWLFERMSKMSLAIVEAILTEYGHKAFLAKMSDPFWFQSFGAVIGMDWNSSGVTTTVMRALRDSVAGTIYSGTSEVLRNMIARQIGLV